MLADLERALQQTLPMATIETVRLPDCQGLTLGLINADFPTGPLPAETMHRVLARPAYWSLCWGSGLALAQFLLANPHWVQGKRVVDLGSGSGVAGIAAALAGATSVVACDTDAHARLASTVNATLNDVSLTVTGSLEGQFDILLMADVLYDKANLPLLTLAHAHANEVLVADSRVTQLPNPEYREIARIDALTLPNLGEFDEYKTAHLFHWQR